MYMEEYTVDAPIVCDGMDDAAMHAYAAWPERLYVIQGGKVAYKGGKGPDGYVLEELEQWLESNTTQPEPKPE